MQREIFLKKIELTGYPYTEAEKNRLDGLQQAAVWLTDDVENVRKLVQTGECVVYLLTPGNREVFCPEAEWCVEVPESEWYVEMPEPDGKSGLMKAACDGCRQADSWDENALPGWLPMDFLWKVWLRRYGLPWQICETGRLYLREMTEEDLDFLYFCQQDGQSARFVAGPVGARDEELEKMQAYRRLIYGFYGFGLWMVCEKETGRPVGRAGLQIREEFEIPELGFEIEASYRRRGYAREALEAVLRYAKEELELDELRSVVDVENTASQRLCEALGFTVQEYRQQDGREWIFYGKHLAASE